MKSSVLHVALNHTDPKKRQKKKGKDPAAILRSRQENNAKLLQYFGAHAYSKKAEAVLG
jgi:hypothetical protein